MAKETMVLLKIAVAIVALFILPSAANAYSHIARGLAAPTYSESEARKQRDRNEWVDRERARQEVQEYNRQQEKLLYDAQSGSRFLDSLRKQGGLYERSEGLFDLDKKR